MQEFDMCLLRSSMRYDVNSKTLKRVFTTDTYYMLWHAISVWWINWNQNATLPEYLPKDENNVCTHVRGTVLEQNERTRTAEAPLQTDSFATAIVAVEFGSTSSLEIIHYLSLSEFQQNFLLALSIIITINMVWIWCYHAYCWAGKFCVFVQSIWLQNGRRCALRSVNLIRICCCLFHPKTRFSGTLTSKKAWARIDQEYRYNYRTGQLVTFRD